MHKKVLVIDDDTAIRNALAALLNSEGYDVLTVGYAEKAVDTMLHFHPDIIILDYMLSGITGYDVYQQMQYYGEIKNTPVIMISAHHRPQTTIKTSGISDFLPKPFDIQDLLDKVEYHLN